MKNTLLFATIFIVSLFVSKHTIAQLEWTQKANLPTGPRYDAKAFSIGNKGYVGTGAQPNVGRLNDFWEFDPATNNWTQKANFGGVARDGGVAFSIGTKGYMGLGADVGADGLADFWEYDPITDTWTQKANFAGGPRFYAVGFSIGNKGYVGTGHYLNDDYADFWEYDPVTDIWTQKADLPGGIRHFAVGFSIGSKGYLGTGYLTSLNIPSVQYSDFWEYDPITDTWTQKADFGGGGRMDMEQGFSILDNGYCGTGQQQFVGTHNDFWQYNQTTNTWTEMSDFGGGARLGVCAFSIGCKGYIGNGSGTSVGDFWEFFDSTNTSCITQINELKSPINIVIYPNPFYSETTLKTDQILNNASITIIDCYGQIVKQIKNISGQTTVISRDMLPCGIYILRLSENNKIIATKKLLISNK